MKKKIFVLLSPILVILIGFLTAKILSSYIREWAFIPLALVYWGLMFYISYSMGIDKIKSLFAKPTGKLRWLVLALIVGLIPLSILLTNLKLLNSIVIIILWIVFAIINPFMEEVYWRGYLLNNLQFNSRWKNVLYSTFLFTLSHPLMWGLFSIANRNWMTLISLTIMGTIWSIVYYKSKSLWWCVISHFMVDIFNLSVFVFLNLYVPPRI